MEQLPELPITLLAIPLFAAAMLCEVIVGKWRNTAKYETRDTLLSLIMGLIGVLEGLLSASAYGAILFFFYQYRITDIEFSWLAVAVCFVLEDLKYYWIHRIEHRVRWMWASHVNHHSSQHYNLSTALRQTWTFFFTGLIVLSIPLVLLGFNPAIVAFCAGVNLAYQFFIHTETVGKLPKWIEAIMNTPSHHRVHHGSNPKYLDANYAGVFIIWDNIFDTFVPEDPKEPCRYGIVQNLNTFNILVAEFHEWIAVFKDISQPGISFKDRICYMFKPPGWSHDGSRQTADMIKQQHVRLIPETAGQPGLPQPASYARHAEQN